VGKGRVFRFNNLENKLRRHNLGITLYYDNLTFVRTKNDLGQWIRFFLTGVTETAENAVATLHEIIDLKAEIEKNRIMAMGRRFPTAMLLLTRLFKKPVINVKDVQFLTSLSPKAANDLVQIFLEHNILKEIAGNRRNRVFAFEEYIKLF